MLNLLLYLKTYGYLRKLVDQEMSADQDLSAAIKDFQKLAGLKETGELDNETIAMMNVPRCGVKDKIEKYEFDKKKHYAPAGSKWTAKEITYYISKYPSGILDKARVQNEIGRAFKMWSDVTTLNFKEKFRRPVNIDIRFETGYHGDGYPFDGPGSTVAHAAFPHNGGGAHFDDGEIWTINETSGINLFQVAAHQFGHSLGLFHSAEKLALMSPFYKGYISEFKLHSNDIEAIQALYGSRNQQQPSDEKDAVDIRPSPKPENVPDICEDAKLDTITVAQNGRTYAFKGDYYWETLPNGSIHEGYPRKISDDWEGLEGNLDASFTLTNGSTYFFKGRHFLRFFNKKMDGWYPKLISIGFKGIPDNLDAAVVWNGDGKVYFFKGNLYWSYDFNEVPPVNRDYPMTVREWSDKLWGGINAAVRWENNLTYFFKGDQYYRYDDNTYEISTEVAYPLSTGKEWFGCRN